MSLARVFPQLFSGLILLLLGLAFWRLHKFYKNREHNNSPGWSNNLLVFLLELIAIAFGIFQPFYCYIFHLDESNKFSG